ncbi:MAG TPA: RnfABCDGE type electron transport complex subunit D, partial [Clostridia bacterium]|nr:RnfABCDGE type electron transport complex subunit D [Clostridia bacterium]
MNTYPLIRRRLSNEHLLAVLFVVASLYQLPDWIKSAASITGYLLFVAAALLLDSFINYLRYRKAICAASAAVTAAVLYPVAKGLPGWAAMLGIAAALIIGKHIWGGTGRNIFNPAVTGMFILGIFFHPRLPIFESSGLLLPALFLSIPFVYVRVFPGMGFMAGMLSMLMLRGGLDYANIIAYGVTFWGCIVVTDPATATDRPVAGALAGFLAGFASLYFAYSIFAFSAAILLFNVASFILGSFSGRSCRLFLSGLDIKPPIAAAGDTPELTDLSGKQPCTGCGPELPDRENILEQIRKNEVFGMGGGGFPLAGKLEAVIKSGAKEKYIIINAVECDPGLLHDKWLMKNKPSEIAKGAAALGRIAEFGRIYCAVKETESFSLPEPVVMYKLPARYPYGAERILTEKLLGIVIPENSNPAQYGVLILNVQTVLSAYEAVCCNEKADTRFITVADLPSGTGWVAKVRLGERIKDIAERAVGSKGMLFAGGGIMQAHSAAEGETVERATNFIAVGMPPKYKESTQCINCGFCRRYCPMGLNVRKIAGLVDEGKLLEAQAFNSGSCIHCGICSYVCPAGRNLSGRLVKKNIGLK